MKSIGATVLVPGKKNDKKMAGKLKMHLTAIEKLSESIWKCLKWISYFSLTATAILFAKEFIEKFLGQNTGIMQNMGKIESHPSVTICPFIDKCDRQGVPKKIIVKLKDAANDTQFRRAGTYILGTKLVNGKAYWIQDGSNALWWCEIKNGHLPPGWLIGKITALGSNTGGIYSPDDEVGPLEANSWKYYSKKQQSWINAGTDIAIFQGICYFLRMGYKCKCKPLSIYISKVLPKSFLLC